MATFARIFSALKPARPNHQELQQVDDSIVMPAVYHLDFYLNDEMAARQQREMYGND